MDENLDKKISSESRIVEFVKDNKRKILFTIALIILIVFLISFLNLYNDKKNTQISEQYIKGGLLLAEQKNDEANEIFGNIIMSKNNFYSILALNTIIEKNLEKNENKILNYFDIIEKIKNSKEQKDLISLKKALFLLKNSRVEEGNKILKKLIETEFKLKFLAKEILKG